MGALSTSVETLRPGETLRHGMAEATVKSVRTLQPRVRNLVTITYVTFEGLEGFLTLTDDHALQVRRGCMPPCVQAVKKDVDIFYFDFEILGMPTYKNIQFSVYISMNHRKIC